MYKELYNIPISVLDLAVIGENKTTKETLNQTLETAQFVEKIGYNRFWMAEHHNMAHIASSATAVLLGYVAQGTTKIRVGSGGIMLPNHSPLVIAEQFGTLETLYPNRIDLGLGRAPGTDQITARVLRRNEMLTANNFQEQIEELQSYFENQDTNTKVRAFPGEGLDIPIWILGSSTDSAFLAAKLGLPYAFASHFAPEQLQVAGRIYKEKFQPSKYLDKPYFMACVNAIVADTEDEAMKLSTSLYKIFLGIIRNDRKPLQKPSETMEGLWNEEEEAMVFQKLACSFIGIPETLKPEIQRFCDILEIDELIINAPIYNHLARLHSFDLFNQMMRK